jgi:hypothetical protein
MFLGRYANGDESAADVGCVGRLTKGSHIGGILVTAVR